MTIRPVKLLIQSAIFSLSIPVAALAGSPAEEIAKAITGQGLAVRSLRVVHLEGITVLRGIAQDQRTIDAATVTARSHAGSRVANLMEIAPPPDDNAIRMEAERLLARMRSLEGCNLSVASSAGNVRLSGTVRFELQKDVARDIVRTIEGVRDVQTSLTRI